MDSEDLVSKLTIFNSAFNGTFSALSNIDKNGSVVIVSRDSQYLALGKSVKDGLNLEKVNVSSIVFSDDEVYNLLKLAPIFDFSENIKLIVAVGDADTINLARYYSTKASLPCLAIPTDVDFYSIYGNKAIFYEDNFPVIKAVAPPINVVLDKEHFAVIKKHLMADAFMSVVSKCVNSIEFILDGQDDKANKIFQSLLMLNKINTYKDKRLGIIMNAQLMLARINIDEPIFNAEFYVGYILSRIKNLPLAPSMMLTVRPILNLYEAFFELDIIKQPCTPNYIKRVEQLSETIKIPENKLLENIMPMELEEIIQKTDEYYKHKDKVLKVIKEYRKLLNELELAYQNVYSGKQKRADFTQKEMKKAFAMASTINRKGLYKLLSDSGVIECFD